MTKLCLFVANLLMFKTIVEAAAIVADGQSWTHKDTAANGAKESRNVISPRMDFDEWTPLGRGDPLKDDPTFDYLPPVLDKVHYWKPPPSAPQPVNRAQHSSASPPQTVNYNRRFFLTDFSKKEPAAYAQYVHKRLPSVGPVAGYHYATVPRTPLPMLTPPPYQRPTSVVATTVEPIDMSSLDAGNSPAESKVPPTVRAPPPPPRPFVSGVARPVLSPSVIKVLLENEVDRTAVTTPGTTTTTAAGAPPTVDPSFPRYKPSGVTARPMYLIIQGHSKVKTYGSAGKPDDLLAAQSTASAPDHNHIGDGPDERSRRKRNNGGA